MMDEAQTLQGVWLGAENEMSRLMNFEVQPLQGYGFGQTLIGVAALRQPRVDMLKPLRVEASGGL